MTGVMEERHLTNGASILEKALGFTAFSTPKVASDRHSARVPSVRPQLPLGSPLATHCLERIERHQAKSSPPKESFMHQAPRPQREQTCHE